jgi:hypothetical protein
MDYQMIIVIIIVSAAFTVAAYRLYDRFIGRGRKEGACCGCAGCDIKKELRQRSKTCHEHPEMREKWSSEANND